MAKTRTLSTFALALILVSSSVAVSTPVLADVPPLKWTRVSIPDQGDAGKWVLASGSDVTHLAMAADGTLYAAANPSATTQRLFKSTDNGTSWSPTGQATATIVDVASAPDDPSLVYYATSSNVYRSSNAGVTFASLPPSPGGAGSNNISITSITVTGSPATRTIAVATMDSDPGQFGGVYTLDEGQLFPAWQNTNLGGCDVLAIASPSNCPSVRHLVAVTTNETDTAVIARMGTAGWASTYGPAVVRNIAATGASIAFHGDYGLNLNAPAVFVGLQTRIGKGDVYKVTLNAGNSGSTIDLNAGSCVGLSNIDVTALALSGNSTGSGFLIVAGSSGSSRVLISSDGGSNWTSSAKDPTGTSLTGLIAASDDGVSHRVFAATSGVESAFSRSDNGAVSWNQTGLVDSQITSSGLIDLAVSSNYSSDGSLFLLTWGGKHSLWRTRDDGTSWQRIFCSALAGIDALSMVAISPSYGHGNQALFVAGTAGGFPAIWKSSDGGETFTQRYVPYAIDAWAMADKDTVFITGYDGANAIICSTQNGGFFYSQPIAVGNQPLKSVVLSPNFDDDTTILAGNTVGKVYISTDNGTTFRQLGQTLPLSGTGAGQVSIAFDPDFAHSKRVFAATEAPSTSSNHERIFTLVIGKSDAWESIDGTFPLGGIVNKITLAWDGTLYATNSKAAAAATSQGGFERSLDPNSIATFETVIKGLNEGATLRGLWASGNQLWSLDTTNTRLMTFMDTMTKPPALISPADGLGGVETNSLRLEWEGLSGATTYQWQLNGEDGFSDLPAGFDATTQSSSCHAPSLDLANTYYWRVRVTTPIKSPWSERSSFTTKLGTATIAPQLLSPQAGATGVPPNPIFQWTSLAEAETYELLLGAEGSLTKPTVARTGDASLAGTAWQSDLSLDYGSTYFWKVRAVGANSSSAWSNVGGFTVQPAPTPTSDVTVPLTTTQIIQVTMPTPLITTNLLPAPPGIPAWLLYAIGVVGFLLVGVLSAILIVLLRRR